MKIGYVRVSDDDQTLNLQIDALQDAGCDVIYGDHGVSGTVVQRCGLDDVLSHLERDDTLCVWKLDRLGRSTVHLLLLLEELRTRGVEFIAVTQGIDTTTAVGRMVYGQLALFAEFEREQICERTRAGMAAAKRRGVHVGRPRKLTTDQIRDAHRQLNDGTMTVADLANAYDVSACTVRRSVRWRKR